MTTGRVDSMSHRKWRETKQHPSRASAGYQISCCLLSLNFLCDILSGGPVEALILMKVSIFCLQKLNKMPFSWCEQHEPLMVKFGNLN